MPNINPDVKVKDATEQPTAVAVPESAVTVPRKRLLRVHHRDGKVRRLVREMAASLAYTPTAGDLYALVRWASIFRRWRSIDDRLERDGETKKDGDLRKLLPEWRALSAELRALEASLGITAGARAALGLDVARGRQLDLAADHADGEVK